ncbi:MAG: ArsR/SmtB family transcription factor [Desulfovibrio sp.]
MRIVQYCKALGDETRWRLVRLLARHELNVGELVEVLGMGQSRISRHLRILAEAGLVRVRREGLWAFYRAGEDEPAQGFLAAAEAVAVADAPDGALEGSGAARDLERAEAVLRRRVQATRTFFDAVAPEWERLRTEVLGGFDLAGAILAAAAPQGVGPDVAADLGCGTGDLLQALAGAARLAIGVDNSPGMIETARTRFGADPRVSLRIGELDHLPLRDGEADFAVLSLVLHHFSDPAAVLAEAGRVLRPGGRLVVAEFDRHELERMRTEYGDHRLGIARADMRRFFDQSGFRLDREDETVVNQGLRVVLYQGARVQAVTPQGGTR